jgi:hypothetical protein
MSNHRDVRVEFAHPLHDSPCTKLAVLCLAVSLMFSATACDPNKSSSVPSTKPSEVTPSVAPVEQQPSAPTRAAAEEPAVAPNTKAAASNTKAAAPDARCTDICEHTVKLACGSRQACMDACAEANDGSICDHEMRAFVTCSLTHPVAHWECTENGVAAIKQGFCDGEQQDFVRCFEAAASN